MDRQKLIKVLESFFGFSESWEDGTYFYNLNRVKSAFNVGTMTIEECMNLMGFSNEDAKLIQSTDNPKGQIYKQIGNSISVTVLEEIFKELFKIHITS